MLGDELQRQRPTRSGCLPVLIAPAIVWACLIGAAIGHAQGPTGYGLLQGGNRNNSLTDAQLKHPKISFIVLRDRWNKQEPKQGQFDFSYLAGQIRRVRKAGKGYIIAPMTGAGATPDFVPGPRYKNSKGEMTLAPWAPAIPAYYGRYVDQLANLSIDGVKVKDDPACLSPWCTGPTVPSQELHLNGLEKAPGHDSGMIVKNWAACFKATHAAFPNKPGILSLSGQTAVLKYQPQIIAAMKAEYGKGAIFQHNSLGKQTNVNAPHHQAVLALKREGYRVGAEMVQPGQTPGLAKFPQANYFVLYPGDEKAGGLK